MRILYTILFVATICLPASATIINIPHDYNTIQEGIDASTDSDTVLVQPGTYVENINFHGHNITLGSLFLMTGDTAYISETIIDGGSSGSVVTFESGEDTTSFIAGFVIQNGLATSGAGIYLSNSSSIIDHNIVQANIAIGQFPSGGGGIYCYQSNAIISNNAIRNNSIEQNGSGAGINCSYSRITITNNKLIENHCSYGSGIFCYHSSYSIITNNDISENSGGFGGGIYLVYSDIIIRDNLFGGNSIFEDGGAIYCAFSNVVIASNIIINNSSHYGGGIICYDGQIQIRNNIISGNYSTGGGGLCIGANAIITNNVFINNACDRTGGGIQIFDCELVFRNNTLIGNSSDSSGGAISCWNNANPTIINNTISRNMANSVGGGLFCFDSSPTLVNNIFWEDSSLTGNEIYIHSGSPELFYCNIDDSLWPGEGNISADPLFRNPENGDFHLMSTACGDTTDSPCIDAGDPTIFDSILDCDWGLGELRSDMGAYGGEGIPTDVDEEQTPEIPLQSLQCQNYPNPFNSRTIIQYNLPVASDVAIIIYDLLGRRVETLVQAEQPAGYHQVIWDAKGQSSGMYFYTIRARDHSETRKMILIK